MCTAQQSGPSSQTCERETTTTTTHHKRSRALAVWLATTSVYSFWTISDSKCSLIMSWSWHAVHKWASQRICAAIKYVINLDQQLS
eukprot:3028418-Amphidinium_carterae.1